MAEENKKEIVIQQVEKTVANSPIAETVINVFKAGLATAPFAGGFASLISDYIPSARFIRLESFAKKTAEDLNQLADQVNEDYLQTDSFAFMFEKCFRGAAENPQKEKLDSFRGMLVNSAINHNLTDEEKEYFVNLVNNLSVVHIRIIKFMARPKVYLSEMGIPENHIQGGFETFFPVAIPGIDLEVIKSAVNDLNQSGLVGLDRSNFRTVTSSKGLELLGKRVTDLGQKFIQFCTSPIDNKEVN